VFLFKDFEINASVNSSLIPPVGKVLLAVALFASGSLRAQESTSVAASVAAKPSAELKTKVEASVLVTGGNTDVKSWSFGAELRKESQAWKSSFKGSYLRSSQSGVLSADEHHYEAQAGKKLDERLSVFLQPVFHRDEFKGIDKRSEVNVGLDYVITNTEKTKWESKLAVGALSENQSGGETLNDMVIKASYDLKHALSDSLDLAQNSSFATRSQEFADWRLRASVGLETPVHPNVKFKTSFEFERQNLPPSGKVENDYKTMLSLIAEF